VAAARYPNLTTCYGPKGLRGQAPRRRGLPLTLPGTGGRVGLIGQFGIGAPGLVQLYQAALTAMTEPPDGAPGER